MLTWIIKENFLKRPNDFFPEFAFPETHCLNVKMATYQTFDKLTNVSEL